MAIDVTKLGNVTHEDIVAMLQKEIDTETGDVLPTNPTVNGTYWLKAVKNNGGVTLSWSALPETYSPPATPDTDGAYLLTRTVAEGAATDTWESAGE